LGIYGLCKDKKSDRSAAWQGTVSDPVPSNNITPFLLTARGKKEFFSKFSAKCVEEYGKKITLSFTENFSNEFFRLLLAKNNFNVYICTFLKNSVKLNQQHRGNCLC
jgi:hypothetical protein